MSHSKALSMIGLATKAGKVASGEFSTEKEVKSARAYLVIVAGDASENTKKKFRNMCEFYQVPIYFYKDKDTLGHAMGKEFRASLAILDEGLAKGIRRHLEYKKTIIMVTHDPKMASYCSRIILLKDGQILEELKREKDQDAFYHRIVDKMQEL